MVATARLSVRAAQRRPGRRPGTSQTRETILQVALEQFADLGYNGTTMRGVAEAAGVDPSLVHHFFTSKQGLFTASLDLVDEVARDLAEVFDGGPDGLARRLATAYFSAWEDPITGPRLRAIARAASDSPVAAALIRRSFESNPLIQHAATRPDGAGAAMQALLSHLLGTAFARYILGVHPLADLPLDELADLLEPTLEAAVARTRPSGLRRRSGC